MHAFINSKNRDHKHIFADELAFYDLYVDGTQNKRIKSINPKDICIVASYFDKAKSLIKFDFHEFSFRFTMLDNKGANCNVLFGFKLYSKIISKEKASKDEAFKVFFSKKRHFKQKAHQLFPDDAKLIEVKSLIDSQIDTDPEEVNFTEGRIYESLAKGYSRNKAAREYCIRKHGAICKICSFDARNVFGHEYSGLIHVHHINPLATVNEEHTVDPSTQLIPVCPNCHAALHFNGIDRDVKSVSDAIRTNRRMAISGDSQPKTLGPLT